jgi:UDP-GlcNAc:undecaprenyl-phosphate GlcNAc-1-phosphate transferase
MREIAVQLMAGVIAFVIALLVIPVVNRWAREFSLLDVPDEGRRRHALPTPRLGGIGIFVAAVGGAVMVWGWERATGGTPAVQSELWASLLLGSSVVFVTGLIDDVRGVGPFPKLLAQGSAALIVIGSGFRIEHLTLAGGSAFDLGIFSVPITLLWIVGLTNAFNLIDGVDGLAGAFALIGLAAAFVAQSFLGGLQPLLLLAAVTGAVMGFLRFNTSPAKIFLGDGGSMTLGFFLSVQLIVSSTHERGWTFAVIPLFAVAYPLLDTTVAISRRWLRGHPFATADGRHIHHQVLSLGLSPRRAVDLLGFIFFWVAAMGILIAFAPPRVTLLLVVGAMILMFTAAMYGIRWLGYHEFTELGASIASLMKNARGSIQKKIVAGDVVTRLADVRTIEQLRQVLNDSAEDLGFLEVSVETQSVHYVGPKFQQISPAATRPLRVDVPIVLNHTDGSKHDAVVRFWCERPTTSRYVGAERIISRIIPAVQRWLDENPAPPVPAEEAPRPHRASGAHRLSPIID